MSKTQREYTKAERRMAQFVRETCKTKYTCMDCSPRAQELCALSSPWPLAKKTENEIIEAFGGVEA